MMIEAYNFHEKEQLKASYESSKLTAYFVGLSLAGKEVPEISQIYPTIFKEENTKQKEDVAAIQWQEKQFAMLAAAINSSRKGKK